MTTTTPVMVNLGGQTAHGDPATMKTVVLFTITDTQYIPKYTYSFTVNGHTGEKRARVDLYGTTLGAPLQGKLEFIAGASDEGMSFLNLGQLEWTTD